MMSLMVASLSSGSSGPRPNTSSRISSISRSRSAMVMGSCSSTISCSTTLPICSRTLSLLRVLSCSGVSELSSFEWTWVLISNQRSAPVPDGRGRFGRGRDAGCPSRSLCRSLPPPAFAPVALSTNARKTRSSSAAASRSATKGRPLFTAAMHGGRGGNSVKHRLVQRLLNLLEARHVGTGLLLIPIRRRS